MLTLPPVNCTCVMCIPLVDVVQQSMMAVPVVYDTRLFAVVYVEHDESTAVFSSSMLPVLNAIATQLAISFESLQATAALRESRDKLQELSKVCPLVLRSCCAYKGAHMCCCDMLPASGEGSLPSDAVARAQDTAALHVHVPRPAG